MTKEVCINIRSVQSSDEDRDVTELFTAGKLTKKDNNDNYQLYYEESDALGFEGCNVTLDVFKDSVRMVRRGTTNSCLYIERGKKHHCHYGTPYGDIMIGINTDAVCVDLDDTGGNLYLKYTVDVNSGFLSENEMFIT
ncbi:MAG: DUF1934 domain-containing protein, partial [Firmicutes bacterium]|nr:DUF1934 domain-containing protein [Bacillota bacterium]